MRIAAALFAFVVVASLIGALVWQIDRNAALRDDNARLTRNAAVLEGQVDQARLAANVAAARAKMAQQISADAAARIEAIRNLNLGECADEAIDPALADILGSGMQPGD